MNSSLILLVLVIPLCKLNLTLSYTHSNTFYHFNRLFSESENAESPRSTNVNRILSDQNNKNDIDDNSEYTINKDLSGESTVTDLNKHIKIVESFIKKVTHIWKHPELKGEVQKVLKSFNIESLEHGTKTLLESQSNELMDYNNLGKKLEVLIIKEYDKVQKELSELDTLFHDIENIDIFAEIDDKCIKQTTDEHCVEKPSIYSLIINKLKQKSGQINNCLTRFCNKYLFSNKIIKFLIRIIFPPFKKNIGAKHININDILNFYDIPLDDNFSLGNIQIYRHSFPSTKKDAWRLTFLGTGSRRVTPTRGASSIAFEPKGRNGPIWLFDCGEGTRLNLLQNSFSPNRVEKIFLTHLHGDHSLGVFSFISELSKWGKVEIYGPEGIGNMINSVHSAISRCFNHKCVIKEFNDVAYNPPTLETYKIHTPTYISSSDMGIKPDKDLKYDVLELHNIKLTAVPIRHNLPTVGYILEEIEVLNGKAPRTICILQDTCDATLVNKFIKSPDILIHESTYSTVSISGTKKYISYRDQKLMDEVTTGEYSKSCYDAASALAMDLAISKRTGALKKNSY